VIQVSGFCELRFSWNGYVPLQKWV